MAYMSFGRTDEVKSDMIAFVGSSALWFLLRASHKANILTQSYRLTLTLQSPRPQPGRMRPGLSRNKRKITRSAPKSGPRRMKESTAAAPGEGRGPAPSHA